MPISVLIADDTELMRSTIRQLLNYESRIEIVGEARNFAETLELTAQLRPDILLLDLHMPDEKIYPPAIVKNHVIKNTGCVIAISVWNDPSAKTLAEELGAKVLLDKANMFAELVATIFLCWTPPEPRS
jgi:DNA-binding NarL/FixJ family response regulator